MQSNINAAKIVVFLDFGGVSQLLQMLIFLKCELCDRPFLFYASRFFSHFSMNRALSMTKRWWVPSPMSPRSS